MRISRLVHDFHHHQSYCRGHVHPLDCHRGDRSVVVCIVLAHDSSPCFARVADVFAIEIDCVDYAIVYVPDFRFAADYVISFFFRFGCCYVYCGKMIVAFDFDWDYVIFVYVARDWRCVGYGNVIVAFDCDYDWDSDYVICYDEQMTLLRD